MGHSLATSYVVEYVACIYVTRVTSFLQGLHRSSSVVAQGIHTTSDQEPRSHQRHWSTPRCGCPRRYHSARRIQRRIRIPRRGRWRCHRLRLVDIVLAVAEVETELPDGSAFRLRSVPAAAAANAGRRIYSEGEVCSWRTERRWRM